jgi:uncharacterized small protein (DUF1192 family)
VKPRRVKRLDPDGDLRTNALRIVEVRLGELQELGPPAIESGGSKALHDMRIAAKRLRYVLEMTTPAFGEPASKGAKTAKALQDVLGEIHDCDEMVPRVQAHVERLRAADAAALHDGVEPGGKDLDAALAATLPHRDRYRGLEALGAYLTARRAVLHERLARQWAELEPQGFATELLAGLSEPPRAPALPARTGGARR